MSEITVGLPDGSEKRIPKGSTVVDVAAAIGPRLAQAALAGIVGEREVDLGHVVSQGDTVSIITDRSPEALHLLRHSTAHVMAEAIKSLYPEASFGVGPAIEDGFYYDFQIDTQLTPEDLPVIEERMRRFIAEERPFERAEVTKLEALDVFASDPFKRELIDELPEDEVISVYRGGAFTDLCRGPHIPHTGRIGAFKLMKLAGAYWRGDSARPMLQRIYGTAWFTEKDLAAYLDRLHEAEKRDHRRLGRELDLFSLHEDAGAGLPIYHPNGARVLRIIQEWMRQELYRRGYDEVITPHMYKADVWKTSGHWDNYRENMYFFQVDEGEGKVADYGIKPMNCPGHIMVYNNSVRSYRDLPWRMFEFGTVYRHELSGVVHGLMRARGFTQDDAHIFCTPEQVTPEVIEMLDLVDSVNGVFGFEYTAEVSTKPAKSIGSDEMWDVATAGLKDALDSRGMDYAINEGDGAFYGPKIDIKLRDAIGRTWQTGTIQVDFNNPERFDMTYRTASNTEARPFMLHRTILGSMERFLGILIEHYAGAFPVWLAPVQAVIIPIADRHLEHASSVRERLQACGVRVETYAENEPMRVKIAKAQQRKIPYMLVVGDKEAERDAIAVRERTEGDIGQMTLAEFVERVRA
ncbi:MAG: threonine--tRNA ligase [Clostridiales bacterium]|nr:threonine--tRNA ligase [Clostridiales bacterium]